MPNAKYNWRGDKGYQRERWWTNERILIGLKNFYQDFGFAPTGTAEYQAKQQFTGKFSNGIRSTMGHDQKYPSSATVLRIYSTFREAWRAVAEKFPELNIEVDRNNEEWSSVEDWFIIESVGILPRTEVAETLKRSVPAVKRRLYDLGQINAYTRWGPTLTKAATMLNLSPSIIKRYMKMGVIAYFRGHKCIYLNAADLALIDEVDWSSVLPEYEEYLRKAFAQRIAKILKFGSDFRKDEPYKLQKKKNYYAGRIRKRRRSRLLKKLPPQPLPKLNEKDWVMVTKRIKQIAPGRYGRVERIYFSPQRKTRSDKTTRESWMVQVEFPKMRGFGNGTEQSQEITDQRIRYAIPMDVLKIVDPPEIPPKALSMDPEAVRGRKRRREYVERCRKMRERLVKEVFE